MERKLYTALPSSSRVVQNGHGGEAILRNAFFHGD
jgi:hypothetical protein